MTDVRQIIIFLAAFLIVAVAANQISKLFVRIRLPMVTGLLINGIIAGPDLLGLITADAVTNLISDLTEKDFFAQIHIEPLLVCIIGSHYTESTDRTAFIKMGNSKSRGIGH